jgi:hypothetical protein
MIPPFDDNGNLPPGAHEASWQEFSQRFGVNSHRRRLLQGLRMGLLSLQAAGCKLVYIDGSFVTAEEFPSDYDGCWEEDGVDPFLLDPILLRFDNKRAAQKAKYLGEFFPAQTQEKGSGKTFLQFFQNDKWTGDGKGIIVLDLRRL